MEEQLGRIAAGVERIREGLESESGARRRVSWRRMALHFLEGLFRGFGMAVGFATLGAMAVVLLRRLAAMNLPLIGGYLAEVIRIVLERL